MQLAKSATFLWALLLSMMLQAEPVAPIKLDWQGFRGGIFQSGDLFIAGQPLSRAAMEKLKASGVTTIINMRTDAEMADKRSTPIDEVALIESLGMSYIHIPSGGEAHPYSSTAVEQFANAMDEAQGKVLLHCNSARRATHLWVAHLIDNEHLSAGQAISLGRAANFGGMPLEGYLDGKLGFDITQ